MIYLENLTNRGESGLDFLADNTDFIAKEDESGLIKKSMT